MLCSVHGNRNGDKADGVFGRDRGVAPSAGSPAASTPPARPYRTRAADSGFSITNRSSWSPSSVIAVQVREPGA